MKNYFIFFICIASLVWCIFFLLLIYLEDSYEEYALVSSIGFGVFVFIAFYLWKTNFFKKD